MTEGLPARLVFCGAFALIAMSTVLAVATFPIALAGYRADRVAQGIAQGNTFNPGDLDVLGRSLAPFLAEEFCPETLVWDNLMVRTAEADAALRGEDFGVIDDRIDNLERAARDAVVRSPSDGVAWLILYWVQTRLHGFQSESIKALRASYRFAPREAWVSLRRSRLVMSVFPFLPDDLKLAAREEFRDLIRAGLLEETVDILARLDAQQRTAAIEDLKALPPADMMAFEDRARARGITSDAMTAVPEKERRPWQ